ADLDVSASPSLAFLVGSALAGGLAPPGGTSMSMVLPVGTPLLSVACSTSVVAGPSDKPESNKAAASSSWAPSDFDLLGGGGVGRLTGGSVSTRKAKLNGPTVSCTSWWISMSPMICRPFTNVPLVLWKS